MTSGPSQHASGPSQRQPGLTVATPVSPVTTRGVFGLADTALYSRMSLLAGFSGAGTTPWSTKPPLRVPEPPEQVPVDPDAGAGAPPVVAAVARFRTPRAGLSPPTRQDDSVRVHRPAEKFAA